MDDRYNGPWPEWSPVLQSDGSWLDHSGDRHWIDSDGKFHREDGPAILWNSGGKRWLLHGKGMTYVEWYISVHPDMSKADKVKLVMKYG